VAINRPPTVLFRLFQLDEEGQHESPGKHLQDDESAAAFTAEAKRAAMRTFMVMTDRPQEANERKVETIRKRGAKLLQIQEGW
jgi:hypothetical protein